MARLSHIAAANAVGGLLAPAPDNRAMNVVEPFQRMARQQPDRPAFSHRGRQTSYRDLLVVAGGLARGFLDDGVKPGDIVTIVCNPALRLASTLALGWIGAVPVAATGMPRQHFGEFAKQLGISRIYAPADFLPGGEQFDTRRIEPLVQAAPTAEPPPLWDGSPDALWLVAISSGTTGRAKGIACSYTSLLNVHLLRTVYPCGPGDVVVIAMNAHMSFAIHNWLRCLYSGACVVLAEDVEHDDLLALVQSDQPTHCIVTPSVANALAAACAKPDTPSPAPGKRLHTLSVGGGRVSVGVREALGRHLCSNVIAHYGAAEAQLVAILDPALAQARPDCSGRVLPWIEVQAVGEDGGVLQPGTVGRLRMRSPAMATGYVGHEDVHAFRDGWFFSSDVGSVEPDGIISIRGRADDVINYAGRKFDPEMMEEAIMKDRAITECAVIDVPGDMQSELVAVIVNPGGTADITALLERCHKALGLAPRRVIRTDKLPRNNNGKIIRGVLRRALRQQKPADANAS